MKIFGFKLVGVLATLVSSGIAFASPGVSISGGATLTDWGSPHNGQPTFTATETTLIRSDIGDSNFVPGENLSLLLSYVGGMTSGQTYTVSFGAIGTGWFDVFSNGAGGVGDTDLDSFLDVTGNEDNALFNASTPVLYRSSLDRTQEVFRVDTSSWKSYSFSFTANAADATLYFKTEQFKSLEKPFNGGLTVGLVPATAVPEPESYAMMLAGLGALGFMARRRKSN